LFNLFINDLAREIKSCERGVIIGDIKVNILLYADDIILLSDSEDGLNQLLKIMAEWCRCWRLNVNSDKSKVIHFRPKWKPKTKKHFWYNEQELEQVDEYKYLGFIVDKNMTFEKGSATLAESGGRALSCILNKLKGLKGAGYNTYTRLYNAGVTPILDYGSEIWGYKASKKIDYVQNRAIRYFLGIPKSAPNIGIQCELGWTLSKIRRYIKMLSLWNKLVNMTDDRLTKIIFNYDYLKGDQNWSAEMEQLFNFLDMTDVYDNQLVCNIDDCKRILRDKMHIEWEESIQCCRKLNNYMYFKHVGDDEIYIHRYMNRRSRKILAMFRLGILPLMVEAGRYCRIKDDNNGMYRHLLLEERVCPYCKDKIEDEVHFLCECGLYDVHRRELYNAISEKYTKFCELSTKDKFIHVMKNCQKIVAKFLVKAWEIRRIFIKQISQ
jgi:hypothetical protein